MTSIRRLARRTSYGHPRSSRSIRQQFKQALRLGYKALVRNIPNGKDTLLLWHGMEGSFTALERMQFLFDKDDQSPIKWSNIMLSSYESFGARITFPIVIKTEDKIGIPIKHKKCSARLKERFGRLIAELTRI